jgi:catechol 2,3-dioxygenase-like lactoylglutathione lyase family enzyme
LYASQSIPQESSMATEPAPAPEPAVIRRLDHVNLITDQLDETAIFYARVLGLARRDPPANLDRLKVQWMYDDGDRPIIHISTPSALFGDDTVKAGTGGGAVHHIALDCAGFEAMEERLEGLGVERRINQVPPIGLRQIFVHDPNGVMVELNFFGAPF